MKNSRISVKRRPVKKGGLSTLFANVVRKKKRQRAATAASARGFEGDVPSLGVARALFVILIIHVIAIGGIFFHSHWLDEEESVVAIVQEAPNPAAVGMPPGPTEANLPKISSGSSVYTVGSGDTYASIASRFNVPENDLRMANDNMPLRQGRYLEVPPPMVTAVEPAELATIRGEFVPPLEPVNSESAIPRAQIVELVETDAARLVDERAAGVEPSVPVASGVRHKVKSGETFWGIAKKYDTTPDAVMKANGITNARRLKIGMNLVIPR